jgi:hypothetical protein
MNDLKLIERKEHASESELANDFIRQARKQQVEVDWLKTKLDKAERSGFSSMRFLHFGRNDIDSSILHSGFF